MKQLQVNFVEKVTCKISLLSVYMDNTEFILYCFIQSNKKGLSIHTYYSMFKRDLWK